ncbi:hypothetical protein [Paenibacillus sp. FSL K6-2859]|uniref:hypothetical protein n=1 Tax=Paenibacillus sp. FSL K6-2859 TaxID=2921482 RepID=UPI0030F62A0A
MVSHAISKEDKERIHWLQEQILEAEDPNTMHYLLQEVLLIIKRYHQAPTVKPVLMVLSPQERHQILQLQTDILNSTSINDMNRMQQEIHQIIEKAKHAKREDASEEKK